MEETAALTEAPRNYYTDLRESVMAAHQTGEEGVAAPATPDGPTPPAPEGAGPVEPSQAAADTPTAGLAPAAETEALQPLAATAEPETSAAAPGDQIEGTEAQFISPPPSNAEAAGPELSAAAASEQVEVVDTLPACPQPSAAETAAAESLAAALAESEAVKEPPRPAQPKARRWTSSLPRPRSLPPQGPARRRLWSRVWGKSPMPARSRTRL